MKKKMCCLLRVEVSTYQFLRKTVDRRPQLICVRFWRQHVRTAWSWKTGPPVDELTLVVSFQEWL
jgi:hypothetical protein